MDRQMTIWDLMPAEVALDPLREVALMASPYWTTSWEDLTEMLAEEPTSTEWVQAVKKVVARYNLVKCTTKGNKSEIVYRYERRE